MKQPFKGRNGRLEVVSVLAGGVSADETPAAGVGIASTPPTDVPPAGATEIAEVAPPPALTRKPRSDKGVKRGPMKTAKTAPKTPAAPVPRVETPIPAPTRRRG